MVWKKTPKKSRRVIPVAAFEGVPSSKNLRATGELHPRVSTDCTEKEMNALFEDMVADARGLGLPGSI